MEKETHQTESISYFTRIEIGGRIGLETKDKGIFPHIFLLLWIHITFVIKKFKMVTHVKMEESSVESRYDTYESKSDLEDTLWCKNFQVDF